MLLLSRLAIHYYRPDFTESQARLLILDLVNDLDEFALAEVETAVKAYRFDVEQRFFPRSAELRELIFKERRHRREMSRKKIVPEFGESRSMQWWLKPKKLWARHWRADDLGQEQRRDYEHWLTNIKASKVKGKNPDEY